MKTKKHLYFKILLEKRAYFDFKAKRASLLQTERLTFRPWL